MMDKLTPFQKIFIGVFTVLVMVALRGAAFFYPEFQVSDFMALGFSVLAALGATHLNQPADKPADKQAGFARLSMILLIAMVATFAIGCTTVMRGYEAAAANEIRQGNDNMLALWKQSACAMPVGAVLRDPVVIETINKFCGGEQATLGAATPINITVQMPAAAASAAK